MDKSVLYLLNLGGEQGDSVRYFQVKLSGSQNQCCLVSVLFN